MENKIILVNASFPSETKGINNSEDIFAIEHGDAEKVTNEIIEALICKEFNGKFGSVATRRKEIEAHTGEILEVAEGKKDNFILHGDIVYTLRERILDEDLVTDRKMSDLKTGDTLFVKYDAAEKEAGVYSVICTRDLVACVPYFRSDGSGTLTLDRYMPFIVRGTDGYLIDKAGEEIAGPFMSAFPIGYGFFMVQAPDGLWKLIDTVGNVKIEAIHPYTPCNGYMQFDKDGKQGFFEPCSGVVSPLFEEVEAIEWEEPVKVKKDGCWGYLAEDFTFLPEDKVEENDGLSDEIYWRGY